METTILLGLHRGYIGMKDKKMEATIDSYPCQEKTVMLLVGQGGTDGKLSTMHRRSVVPAVTPGKPMSSGLHVPSRFKYLPLST